MVMTRNRLSLLDFERIRQRASLEQILQHYRLDAELKRVGSQLAGRCPIHRGSNRRQFVVDLRRGTWHCFGDCARGGGSLELVAEIERLDVRGAAALISQWFSIADRFMARDLFSQERNGPVSGKPTHKVYVVEDRAGDGDENDAFWTRVGSAWPHKDGKGLNVVLSALPVNGRIVLREYTAEDEKADEAKQTQKARYAKK